MIDSISIVIPSYNESENINEVYRRTLEVIKKMSIKKYELIFVENGSKDNSLELLKKINSENKSIKIISLSRNFGYQSAIAVGLKYSENDYVCVMDGDLQDPPEIISKFVAKIKEGYDVVYGIRIKRKGNIIKKLFYNLFYEIYSKLSDIDVPKKGGDFCLMSKKVVKSLNSLSEKNLFMRGLRSWVGFKQTGVEYERDNRYAGKTNFSFIWRGSCQNDVKGITQSKRFSCALAQEFNGLWIKFVIITPELGHMDQPVYWLVEQLDKHSKFSNPTDRPFEHLPDLI